MNGSELKLPGTKGNEWNVTEMKGSEWKVKMKREVNGR